MAWPAITAAIRMTLRLSTYSCRFAAHCSTSELRPAGADPGAEPRARMAMTSGFGFPLAVTGAEGPTGGSRSVTMADPRQVRLQVREERDPEYRPMGPSTGIGYR
jgi:hypothetical protein